LEEWQVFLDGGFEDEGIADLECFLVGKNL
jgi:hypothetical protein